MTSPHAAQREKLQPPKWIWNDLALNRQVAEQVPGCPHKPRAHICLPCYRTVLAEERRETVEWCAKGAEKTVLSYGMWADNLPVAHSKKIAAAIRATLGGTNP